MKKLRITINGKQYEVDVEVLQDDDLIESAPSYQSPPRITDWSLGAPAVAAPPPRPASKPRVSVGTTKTLTSPINGVVLDIPVSVGQEVKENEVLFVVEAMKMKTNISSPQSGKVATIEVKVHDSVEAGQILLTFA